MSALRLGDKRFAACITQPGNFCFNSSFWFHHTIHRLRSNLNGHDITVVVNERKQSDYERDAAESRRDEAYRRLPLPPDLCNTGAAQMPAADLAELVTIPLLFGAKMGANIERPEESVDCRSLVEFVDDQIVVHETSIRNYTKWAVGLISLGLLISGSCFLFPEGAFSKLPDLMKVGPTLLLAPISSYQYSATVFPTRKVLVCYKSWKKTLEQSIATGTTPPQWVVDAVRKNQMEMPNK